MLAAKPFIVVLTPVPVIAPGLMVQVPVGKPFKTTLPVARAHVGWVIVPIVGAIGVGGCGVITTVPEDGEIHPDALVIVKVYDPAANPVIG